MLAEIKMQDYMKTKRAVVNKVMKVDSRLREAVAKKQIDFFKDNPLSDSHSQED